MTTFGVLVAVPRPEDLEAAMAPFDQALRWPSHRDYGIPWREDHAFETALYARRPGLLPQGLDPDDVAAVLTRDYGVPVLCDPAPAVPPAPTGPGPGRRGSGRRSSGGRGSGGGGPGRDVSGRAPAAGPRYYAVSTQNPEGHYDRWSLGRGTALNLPGRDPAADGLVGLAEGPDGGLRAAGGPRHALALDGWEPLANTAYVDLEGDWHEPSGPRLPGWRGALVGAAPMVGPSARPCVPLPGRLPRLRCR